MNVIAIVGNIGQPPEIRYFQTGSVVAKFSVAVRRQRKQQGGEPEQDWFSVEVWGKTAEFVANHCTAGSVVSVTGSMQFDSYVDKQTTKNRYAPKLRADSVQLLRKRRRDGQGWDDGSGREAPSESAPQPAPAAAPADATASPQDADYSDIPF
jgi:single-strand DNA-binding protein